MPRHSLEKVPWAQLAIIPLEYLQDLRWSRYMYLFMLPSQRSWEVDIDVPGCLVSLLTKKYIFLGVFMVSIPDLEGRAPSLRNSYGTLSCVRKSVMSMLSYAI